jgi:flagellar hook-associated protein 2
VTIAVTQSFNGLQSALTNFVSAYNAAFDALQQHRGQNGGALTGDSLIFSMTNVLQQMSQFNSGSGSVSSLNDLGITVDETGHLSFNSTTFANASNAAVSAFLGDINASGFLQSANNALNFITDPVNGLIQSDSSALQSEITSDNNRIADQQAQIDQLQTNLQAQLSQADAAIATLQSQKTYFQELFTATYGNGTGTNS